MNMTYIVILEIREIFRELKVISYLLLAFRPAFKMFVLPFFFDT